MKRIVHSTIDEEHVSLKLGGGDNSRTFSVRLALSVEDLPGDTQIGLVADEAVHDSVDNRWQEEYSAYDRFVDSIGALMPTDFKVYLLPGGDQPPALVLGNWTVLPRAQNVQLRTRFKDWLSIRLREQRRNGATLPADGDHEVTEDELTAFHVLMGAASWPAPIPHELGLVQVITVHGLNPGDRIAVVPLLDKAELTDPDAPVATGVERGQGAQEEVPLPFEYQAGSIYSECRASFSEPALGGNTLLDDVSGFIVPAVDDKQFPEVIRRTEITKRIEKLAGSMFTGFVAASQVEWPKWAPQRPVTAGGDGGVQEAGAQVAPAEQPTSWLDTDDARFLLGCLAWQAASMVGTAFDTLLLALHMPGRSNREGQLLAPFLDILVRDGLNTVGGNQLPSGAFANKRAGQRRRGFRDAIRAGLNEWAENLAQGIQQTWACPNPGNQPPEEGREAFWKATDEPLWVLTGLQRDSTQLIVPLVRYAAARWEGVDAPYKVLSGEIKSLIKDVHETEQKAYLTQRLATEIASLHDTLLSEEGVERTLIHLLERKEVRGKVVNEWSGGDDQPNREAAIQGYKHCLTAMQEFVAQGFNGAEAARQSVGSLIADLAMDRPDGQPSLLDDLLGDVNNDAQDGGEEVADAHHQNKNALRMFWHNRLLDGTFTYGEIKRAAAADAQPSDSNRKRLHLVHLVKDLGRLFPYELDQATGTAPNPGKSAIESAARQIETDAFEALLETKATRFVPEAAPGPLLVPIALDTYIDDDDGVDQFTANFSGLSLLVSRDDEPWAHACLAELMAPEDTVEQGQRWMELPVTLAPLPSAVVDNRRELFISYSGLPFTSNAYSDAIPAGDGDTVVPGLYQLDYPGELEDQQGDDFRRLPPLAYGSTYKFAAHVVGRSGLLPQTVRLDTSNPWLPRGNPDRSGVPVALEVAVSRKTAIGSVAIREPKSRAGRIGCWPKDVLPLSADYPRVSVEPGIRTDLLRNRDGTGMIPLPEENGEPSVVVLRDIEVWAGGGGVSNLTLRVGTNATDDANGVVFSIPLKPGKRHDIKITLQRTGGQVSVVVSGVPECPEATDLSAGQSVRAAWLNLEVDSNCISLADPRPEVSGEESAGRCLPENLLLLGGKTSGVDMPWKEPFSKEVDLEISLPRMSFADFMRWTNNPELVERALEISGEDPEGRYAIFHNFRVLLVSLDIDRFNNPEAAQWLEMLPDLAVSSVEISAIPLDSLASRPGRAGEKGTRTHMDSVPLKMPSLWDLFRSAGLDRTLRTEDLSKVDGVLELEKINKQLCVPLSVASQDSGPGRHLELLRTSTGTLTLSIPSGTTARLTARPLVDMRLFKNGADDRPPILDERLKQYAIGNRASDLYIFDGAGLTIESMIGPLAWRSGLTECPWLLRREQWAEVRDGVLVHHHVEGRPSYALAVKADPDEHWQWRQVGRVTTRTQAWRFTGRPIYSWIDPKAYCDGAVGKKQASFRMKPDKGGKQDEFYDFEKEVFLGRDDDDAQPRTVTLQPIGRETQLVEMHADETKGATLHRHALELHSRYAGAMKHPERDGLCEAWTELTRGSTERTRNADRWVRIAVLARRPAVELTRPQLRALMPLTRRPDKGRDRHTVAPPVLALLQEEPLAFGGLATRIASEIRAGIGYRTFGYKATTGGTDANAADGQQAEELRSTIVLPGDARKEIGPDPRLSYLAITKDVAQSAILPLEGPIGLTFDRDATASAWFTNTALVLHPELASGKQYEGIEENFISVSLRRYLDPAWLIPDDSQPSAIGGNGELSLDKGALWIPVTEQFTLAFDKGPGFVESKDQEPVPEAISINNNKVLVSRLAIDSTDFPLATEPTDPQPEDLLHLCDLPAGVRALLVIPQDKGRLSVSVMFQNSEWDLRGAGNAPVVLASVELRIGSGLRPIVTGKWIPPSLTTASATTALNWVRTNADFDKISEHVRGAGGMGVEDHVSVSDLYATRQGDRLSIHKQSVENGASPIWVRAGQSIRRTPTHVQRHMVALLSNTLTDFGRDIDQPIAAYLLHGNVLDRTPDVYADKLKEADKINDADKLRDADRFRDADKLRLIEIETPAAIMGWSKNQEHIPARYRNAYFDLPSIGHAALKEGQAIMLRLRYVGSSYQLKKATVTLLLSGPTMKSDRSEPKFEVQVPEGSAEIVLFMKEGSPIRKKIILSDGSMTEQKDEDSPSISLTMQAMELSIDSVSLEGDDEVWFEVSMLAGSMERASDFSFDWLFGELRSGHMTDALTPKQLAGRTEAQARIVAVSPAIPVKTSQP